MNTNYENRIFKINCAWFFIQQSKARISTRNEKPEKKESVKKNAKENE